jgi:phosphoglycerate dehydrogenase-like enzyme
MLKNELSVFLSNTPQPDHLAILEGLLDPLIRLSMGEDLPSNPDYEVLVKGRPDEQWLTASDRLWGLVIPFAGLPDTTAKVLRNFPELRIYNLHHNSLPVAEMVMGLLLCVARRIPLLDRNLRMEDWSLRYADNADSLLLHGRRVLILGYGHVGQAVGNLCSALGMQVSAIRRSQTQIVEGEIPVYPSSELPERLPEAEVLIVCLPLTIETHELLDSEMLNLLPGEAMIVNAGRAAVFDEEALFNALADGKIAGAGLDVWFNYPLKVDDRSSTAPSRFPFQSLPNVVMTPHVAGKVQETERLRMEHLAALLNSLANDDDPRNQIDVVRGY